MSEIKYGSFESENRVNKYFSIILDRLEFEEVIKTGAVIYPHSVTFFDVIEHRFCNSEDGQDCRSSPTGFCNMYDAVRWVSVSFRISPNIVAHMLIERLEKVTVLSEKEKEEIRNSINNEQTFVEGE